MNKKKLRLIALDLDGTTLTNEGELLPETEKALYSAHEAGIHIIVASGRSFSSVPKEVKDLPFVDYAITSNGANMYEVKTGKRIMSHVLKKDAVEKILNVALDVGVMVEGFIEGVPYSQADFVNDPVRFGASERGAQYIKRTRRPVDNIHEFLSENAERLDSIDLITGDVGLRKLLRERMSQIEDIYLTSSVPTLLELSDIHAGKAAALKFAAEYIGIAQEETAAFGNAENDIEMLKWAGIGVAVSNAPEDVKNSADELTESCDEDGVGKWLRAYLNA